MAIKQVKAAERFGSLWVIDEGLKGGDKVVAERAAVRRLEREIELHRVRAPIDGAIGKTGDLRAGSVVRPADELASIVPSGPPRVVAFFPTCALMAAWYVSAGNTPSVWSISRNVFVAGCAASRGMK